MPRTPRLRLIRDARPGVRNAEVQPASVVLQCVEPDADLISPRWVYLTALDTRLPSTCPQAQRIADDSGGTVGSTRTDRRASSSPPFPRRPCQPVRRSRERRTARAPAPSCRPDLRVVEDVVDDLRHRLGRGAHRVDVRSPLPAVEAMPASSSAMPSTPFIGVTDLVAGVREELVLESATDSAPGAFLEPRVPWSGTSRRIAARSVRQRSRSSSHEHAHRHCPAKLRAIRWISLRSPGPAPRQCDVRRAPSRVPWSRPDRELEQQFGDLRRDSAPASRKPGDPSAAAITAPGRSVQDRLPLAAGCRSRGRACPQNRRRPGLARDSRARSPKNRSIGCGQFRPFSGDTRPEPP